MEPYNFSVPTNVEKLIKAILEKYELPSFAVIDLTILAVTSMSRGHGMPAEILEHNMANLVKMRETIAAKKGEAHEPVSPAKS